jgi:16S rRNA (cytosine967-C5)-methyltransferase
MTNISRQLAFDVLQNIYQKKAYTDLALQKIFLQDSAQNVSAVDRHLVSELVYGVIRRKRTLDSLINQLASKKASQQPLKLRIILQLGLYQLRYLDKIPPSAAVNTSVELAKDNGLKKLSGVVNGILRSYLRQSAENDCLVLPNEKIPYLGVKYSFPDWIISIFQQQFSWTETEQLLQWFNQSPHLDLRVNILQIKRAELQQRLLNIGIETTTLPHLPQALRVQESVGNLASLPEFEQGLFTIQDASAQLVAHLLNPQLGETVIDACAAPGGKATHLAELMNDTGRIIAVDCHASRLKKITENINRLKLKAIAIYESDSATLDLGERIADRVLVDVPCSGLGTLHKNPDIRWQKKPEQIPPLRKLQLQILQNTAQWVKQGGVLVYSTCTLNPAENEEIISDFLANNPQWYLDIKSNKLDDNFSLTSKGIVKIFPPREEMDGFFMAKLVRGD